MTSTTGKENVSIEATVLNGKLKAELMLNGLLSLAEARLATCLCFHWAVVLNRLLVNRMRSVYGFSVERSANIMKLAVS